MINYSQLLGMMPQVIGSVEDYLGTKTQHRFLVMIERFYDVLAKLTQVMPAKDLVLGEAAKMFDAWKKEN